jgi:hypothetical protein
LSPHLYKIARTLSPPLASYTSSAKAIFQIAKAPPGAQAAMLDIEGTYHTLPCKPDHKRYLTVFFEGFFYIDQNIPFGLASVTGLQGEVADVIIDIWKYLGVDPALKWVDDFAIFCFPDKRGCHLTISANSLYHYSYNLESMKNLIVPLGMPWHKEKGSDFTDIFVYVGLSWNILEKSVSLPESKRLKYLTKIQTFLQSYEHAQAPKVEAESLSGTLTHITFVFLHG